jgi:hypothetical protein
MFYINQLTVIIKTLNNLSFLLFIWTYNLAIYGHENITNLMKFILMFVVNLVADLYPEDVLLYINLPFVLKAK